MSRVLRVRAAVVIATFVALLLPSVVAEAGHVSDGMKEAAWLANGTAVDEVNGNNGTLYGGVAFGPGASGAPGDESFAFDGIDDAVVTNNSIGNFGTSDAFISFDIKTTASAGNVMSKREACNAGSHWDIRMGGGSIGIEFFGWTIAGGVSAPGVINDGNWHHIVFGRQGSTLSASVDGGPPATASTGGMIDIHNNADLMIGWGACVWVDGTLPFQGSLDNVRLTRTGVPDVTVPTISGSAAPAPNGSGWNNSPVTVTFACADGGSGLASCTAPVTVSADGADQAVDGTATDNASNTATTSVSVDLDTTAPTVLGAATSLPNGAGWYVGDVTVEWVCNDSLSGVASCQADTTVSGEGSSLSSLGSGTDNADNVGNGSVNGIKIDRTAPVTTSNAPSGYENGAVEVTLSASDNLSGVESTTYTLDGNPGTGNTVSVSGDGTHVLTFRSTDNAGNVEDLRTVNILIDDTAPNITHSLSPVPNVAGWNRTNTTVTFVCSDALSGVASCTAPSTKTASAANQQTVGTATDNAGNSATDTATVNLDKVLPTISGSRTPANAAGWNNTDVTVTWNCADALSGVASCPAPVVFTAETSTGTTTRTATDTAGNNRNGTVSGIKIDKTPPTITGALVNSPNSNGWFNGPVTIHWTCTDALSGIAVCPADTIYTADSDAGSVTAFATDSAGNSGSGTYSGIANDTVAPSISGAPTMAPNAAGWHSSDVVVDWTCSDSLSGVDTCEPDTTISGEGDSLSSTGSATDKASNIGTGAVTGIRIDRTAPTTTADAPAGYQQGAVQVNLLASDGLSGVDATTYTLDGVPGTGNTVNVTGDGSHTLTFSSVDVAGNVEDLRTVMILIDATAPNITHNLSPVPNAAGWNRANTTVSFVCSDATSGLSSCSGPTTKTTNGANQQVVGTASDIAGNSATDTATVNLDKTAPLNTGTRSPAPNLAGWNNTDVTVTFTCSDALSGVAVCPAPVILGTDTAAGSASGTAFDTAGNSRVRTVSGIKLDKTAPTISGTIMQTPNANGWFSGPVTVHWSCADALSGVETCSSDSVISGEGANQSATGMGTDVAGNNVVATVSGINIDLTAPSLTGAPSAASNGAGWYRSDVTVEWTCGDALSGVGSCPVDSLITGEGDALSATESASDNAGNIATTTVSNIKIDRTAPVTTADAPSGYVRAGLPVTLTASDNLSGVDSTVYSLDGGPETQGDSVQVEGDGIHTLTFRSTDAAGNVEDLRSVEIQIDGTAPVIIHELSPEPNTAGWNNADTTVTFTCSDTGSGVDECSDPTTLTTDGGGQTVVGQASDVAGNEASDTAMVNLDKTAPVITSARSPLANSAGWSNTAVVVTFTCTDETSGIVDCTTPQTQSDETSGESFTGTASDAADNSASDTLGDVKVDMTAPTITGEILETPNSEGWFDGDVTVRWTCDDDRSGVASCPADSLLTNDGPDQSASGVVIDRAGNSSVATVDGINIDSVGPVVTASRDVTPNANGWNRTDVKVDWQCSDLRPSSLTETEHTFTAEGANQSHSVTCTDIAGNATTNTVTVNIDKTAPLTIIDQFMGGDVRGSATDNLSGVASIAVSWSSVGRIETQAVCYSGCGTVLAKWRATPPQPRPNVYNVSARSIDLAGNVGPSAIGSTPIVTLAL